MAKVKIPTVNDKLLNRYIRHSVYLEQLKIGEAKLISRFLKQKTFPKIYEKLIGELNKVKNLDSIGNIYKIKRLKRMLAATQKISTAGMVKAEKMLIRNLVNISKFEAKWNINTIKKIVPVDIDMSMPSNEVLRKLVTMRPMDGHKLGTWMKGYSVAVRASMTKQLKVGVSLGESIPEIGKRIEKALGYKTKQAEFIARTAVSNVVHQAREETFKKNSDIVRKVQWVSTLDDRTSMQCIHLDGRMFEIGDGPRPPIHFNCRSSIIPITPSWQEFGVEDPPPATRASMNGAVSAKTTYKQWIKKQPKAVQVKVLGKKRADLYRSGRVKIDRFVGRDLKPLNLKQLATREGIKIEQELKLSLKSKYKFKNINPVYGKQLSNELNRLTKKFPKANKRLSGVEMLPPKEYKRKTGLSGTACVKHIAGKDKIFFNGEIFLDSSKYDAEKLLKSLSNKKVLVGNNIESFATHEFGHVVFNSLPESVQYKLKSFFVDLNAKDFRAIKSQISKYASEAHHELFAEAFTQWQVGKASPMAKKVLKITGIIK